MFRRNVPQEAEERRTDFEIEELADRLQEEGQRISPESQVDLLRRHFADAVRR